ncbi:MAG: hypothetical protein M1480_15785 [Bacteroidetes bacterium]|nr:hypothetical protein [Bacteroidota bacterium]
MDYLPKRDGDLDSYESTFVSKYPGIAAQLGIGTEEANSTLAIIANHKTAYSTMNEKKAEGKSAVENNAAAKSLAIAEIRRVAQQLKSNKGYTDAVGFELGIVGSAESGSDLESIKPTLKTKIVGGNVVVSFDKQKMDGVKIYSKRTGEAEFGFLAIDTASPYEDNRPKLNGGAPEERQYYAFYLLDDAQVGQQSGIISVTI